MYCTQLMESQSEAKKCSQKEKHQRRNQNESCNQIRFPQHTKGHRNKKKKLKEHKNTNKE